MSGLTRRMTGVMIAAGFVAGIGVAQAKTVDISATLHPAAGVKTSGSGAMHGTFNTVTRKVTWTVTYKDLTSPVIMAHFHGPISKAGQNGPVQVWLTRKPPHPMKPGPITGSATLTKVQAKEMLGGHWYVMVHTKDNKAGEIRGAVKTGM